MAYSNSTGDRMDELRFRQQQSPRNESGITSPLRNGRMPPSMYAHDNGRGSLTRRFTTDSGRVPTITSIANQRGQEVQDYTPSVGIRLSPIVNRSPQQLLSAAIVRSHCS